MRYYVYELLRPDGRPFYVGKGSGRRIDDHEREARRGCACHKCSVIRQAWQAGAEIGRRIIYRTDDEQDAYRYERATIAQYGRESLCNYTDGGEGTYLCGEESPTARITWALVRDIRARYAQGGVTAKQLAGEWGMGESQVQRIIRNEAWYDTTYTPPANRKDLNKPPRVGEHSALAVLTWDLVHIIRRRFRNEAISCDALARQYGVTPSAIVKVIRNLTWNDPGYTPPTDYEMQAHKRSLSAAQIAQAVKMYADGGWSYERLAQHFGVSVGAMWRYLNRS